MNKTGLGALCIGALCSLMIGCGGGGSVDINNLGDALISAQCDHFVKCGLVSSHDDCVALFGQGLNTDEIVGSVNAGKVKYDGALAQDCLDALSAESCDPSAEDRRVTVQACIDAVKGTIADGASCANSNECISGSCSATTGTTCAAGTCDMTAPAPVAIGQSCTNAPCVDGAYCNASGQCAALLAAGATCTGDIQCGYGLVCAGATTQSCVATPTKVGDDCVNRGSFYDAVVDGFYCDGNNKVAAYADSGASCSQTEPCMFDLACNNSSCGALPDVGGDCSAANCSAGNYCDSSGTTPTCAALKANGATCASSSECQTGNCDSTSMKCADAPVCI